jgi:hypothetical protein
VRLAKPVDRRIAAPGFETCVFRHSWQTSIFLVRFLGRWL